MDFPPAFFAGIILNPFLISVFNPLGIPEEHMKINIGRMLDVYLGTYSVLNDPETERRKLYGQAGDIRDKTLRQVVTGAADGAIAAISVNNYLENL